MSESDQIEETDDCDDCMERNGKSSMTLTSNAPRDVIGVNRRTRAHRGVSGIFFKKACSLV